MTYADGRVVFDADSHLMELPGWLETYVEAAHRDRLRPLALGGAGKLAADAVAAAQRRHESGTEAADAALKAELMSLKGWHAHGAFDPRERSRVLDELGFDAQLVFATFAATQYAGPDAELLAAGTRALSRAITAFCADDDRLLPVGFVPWLGPDTTRELVAHAIDEGCAAVQLASVPGSGVSPTHPDYDPMWRLLEERHVPFVLHIGGGGRLLPPQYHDNGSPTTDFLGGGENVRSKDFMAIHHSTETFLSCLVLDGIFDRFPGLRGASIEQGASWVVPWLHRLDQALQFAKTEPRLRELSRSPSEMVREHLRFTPWPKEPIGWMIEQAGEELFMFSSDYPHPEGTRDPIGSFEARLGEVTDAARRKFYAGNFADLMGIAVPA